MLEIIVSVFLGACWIFSLIGIRKYVANTTLMAPWIWAIAASIAVFSVTLFVNAVDNIADAGAPLLHYLAAIATCCPVVALLGAKKPQSRAWQWIVGALWIVLSLPAITAITFTHTTLQLGGVWTSLLWILILLPVGNYLSTRYFFPALLAATAQIFLFVDCGSISLWGAASLVSEYSVVSPTATALFLALFATLTAGYMTPKQSHLFKGGDQTTNLWMEFSQLYGLLWSRRVADRAEKLLDQSGIPIRVGPSHFYAQKKDGTRQPILGDELPPEVAVTLKNLLLRFVSQHWIDAMTSRAVSTRKSMQESRAD